MRHRVPTGTRWERANGPSSICPSSDRPGTGRGRGQARIIHGASLDFRVGDLDEAERTVLPLGGSYGLRLVIELRIEAVADPAGHPFCLVPMRQPAAD
jgi:hypothetical protein